VNDQSARKKKARGRSAYSDAPCTTKNGVDRSVAAASVPCAGPRSRVTVCPSSATVPTTNAALRIAGTARDSCPTSANPLAIALDQSGG